MNGMRDVAVASGVTPITKQNSVDGLVGCKAPLGDKPHTDGPLKPKEENKAANATTDGEGETKYRTATVEEEAEVRRYTRGYLTRMLEVKQGAGGDVTNLLFDFYRHCPHRNTDVAQRARKCIFSNATLKATRATKSQKEVNLVLRSTGKVERTLSLAKDIPATAMQAHVSCLLQRGTSFYTLNVQLPLMEQKNDEDVKERDDSDAGKEPDKGSNEGVVAKKDKARAYNKKSKAHGKRDSSSLADSGTGDSQDTRRVLLHDVDKKTSMLVRVLYDVKSKQLTLQLSKFGPRKARGRLALKSLTVECKVLS